VPFYFHENSRFFSLSKVFAKLGIKVVALGGAMQQIRPALEKITLSVCF
jgi:hypothetical protein